MRYFLKPQNKPLLEAFSFTKVLYAFDFDGTLAKIVPDPEKAFMNKRTEELLMKLAERAPVAVISGRGVEDLKKRVPKEIKFLVGNHGLEGVNTKKNSLKQAQQMVEEWKSILKPALKNDFAGVDLEDKGFSLSLHYRRARRKKETKARLLQLLETFQEPPRVIFGKSVLNLVPSGAPHKGIALTELLQKLKASKALYIGDDETDEDVFSLKDSRVLGVHVGKKKSSQAQYFLEDQSEINLVLKQLLEMSKKAK